MAFSIRKSANSKVLTLQSPRETSGQKKFHRGKNETIVHGMANISIAEKRTPPAINYVSCLMASKRYFALTHEGYFVVADCDSNGNLTNKYCLLQALKFYDRHTSVSLFICSCEKYTTHRLRLSALNCHIVNEDLKEFISREKANYCIHLQRLDSIDIFKEQNSRNIEENDSDDGAENERHVDQLCASPLIVAAYSCTQGYGLLQKDKSGKARMRCSTCSSNVYACDHVVTYKQWISDENATLDLEVSLQEEEAQKTQLYASISQ